MNKEEKKNAIVKILTKVYEWAKGKGWSETVIKVVLGAIFGIICAFCLSGCTLGYESTSQKLDVSILPVDEWQK